MQQWAEIGRFVIIMYLINPSVDTEPFSKHVIFYSVLKQFFYFFIFISEAALHDTSRKV